ncbi:hypothetical protein SETIT_9G459300v2 [Setaria italica]|uniref:Uncharacterized protein n=1 Tax=Setaria italica TaxID=4555 RepID=A0A368SSU7_SETIT|nr:hypothetical protein SETIT_9G459300v2 [Setaria italica]
MTWHPLSEEERGLLLSRDIKRRGGRGVGRLAATERKGLRVKRAKGGRHGISPPSLPPPPPPPLLKTKFPRRCQLMGGAPAASAETGRRNIWFFQWVLVGRERKGDGRARRFLVSTGMYAPAFGIGFFMLSTPRREIGNRSVTAAAECGRNTLRLPGILFWKRGRGRHESCRCRCSYAAASYVQVRSLSRWD